MNAITTFTFENTNPFRAIQRDGQPWFIASDVCAALGLGNPSMAVAKLDADEKGISSVDTLGGAQSVVVVNEGGLYALALRCRDAMTPGSAAHRFRRWVTGEVLPALRKTGSYGSAPPAALNDPAALRSLLLGYSERVIELEERADALEGQNAILAPKAVALDRIATAEGSMNITAAAKVLQVGPRALGDWLRANRWTYRGADGGVLAFQAKIDSGHLETKLVTVDADGPRPRSYWQVLVTPKGITRLAATLGDQRRAA
ncbi:phage antirepressor KilAC domain-containing protein [Sphingomonas sp. BE137]|uniref:phage antirepressor KilAC domain-containing protein n=1 Tax=Sphingomonas sp. BE137 TaxID=2817844 RepID=UPI001AE620D7|nr:phage antirepressor KilAC domain-containing protein [Sphingomonas sp. BE137]MDR6850373.1 prophage antirepressor-like protein [Sphingomonas sp. BE137]